MGRVQNLTGYTQHVTCKISQTVRNMSHAKYQRLNATCRMQNISLHATRRMLNIRGYAQHVACKISQATRNMSHAKYHAARTRVESVDVLKGIQFPAGLFYF